jgi:Ca2+/Na+ antiporter
MMRKNAIIVTIFAMICVLFFAIPYAVSGLKNLLVLNSSLSSSLAAFAISLILWGIALIIVSINLVDFKEWARKAFIILNVLTLFAVIALKVKHVNQKSAVDLALLASNVLFIGLLIYYLTKKEIKDQFREPTRATGMKLIMAIVAILWFPLIFIGTKPYSEYKISQIESGKPFKLGHYIMIVEKKDGDDLFGIKATYGDRTIEAKTGKIINGPDNKTIKLELVDGSVMQPNPENPNLFSRITFKKYTIKP